MNFENSMKKVDEIISKLSDGDVSLEDAISLCKNGADELNRCRKMLDEAENIIMKVSYAEDIDNDSKA